ncbi:MAG: beta-ketoacyl-[acyl-carrier-protein] synthase II [Planctomycetes bacterium RBG_16_43_13]|nr:MAG: beta-ketoacyl-[acyl-carrier-protein] synthase II [Planctomycetes bacterium RBG_16_43_13]
MSRARVVITGVGAVTPLGLDVPTFWEGLLSSKSGIAKITSLDTTSFEVTFAGEVKGFNPTSYIEEKEAKRLDRFAQLAIAAASEAVKDSAIDFNKCKKDRCGAIVGSGVGGLNELQDQHTRYLQKGPARLSPFFIPKMMSNAAAGNIAIRFGLCGPNFAIASACATSNHSIGMAFRMIQYGDADVMLAGGSEAAITYLGINGFACMKALSTRNDAPQKASRPFDKNRDGFVLGEGAGILVLEKLEHAKSRNAKIYAEVLGVGMSDDAYHITAPDPDGSGAALAISAALKDANIKPEHVSYINAHGTSTQLNDKTETLAIKKVFGNYAKKVPISSTKSMIGHLLGAAAAVELIAAALSVKNDIIHPTINYETPDPECDLDYTPNEKRRMPVNVAISNSLGFGGHNTTVAIGKYHE